MKMTYYQVFRKAAELVDEGGGYSCIAVDIIAEDYRSGPRQYYEEFFEDCGRDSYYPFSINHEGNKDLVYPLEDEYSRKEMRVLLLLLVAEEVRGKRLYVEVD